MISALSRRPLLRAGATIGAVAMGAVLALAPGAQAGLVDGSLNNAHVLSGSNVLGVLVNSNLENSNGNSNSRNNGGLNNALGGPIEMRSALRDASAAPDCEITVRAADGNGAAGTATVALPQGEHETEVDVPDDVPGTAYAPGDHVHLSADITCADSATGAVNGLLSVSDDEIAR